MECCGQWSVVCAVVSVLCRVPHLKTYRPALFGYKQDLWPANCFSEDSDTFFSQLDVRLTYVVSSLPAPAPPLSLRDQLIMI